MENESHLGLVMRVRVVVRVVVIVVVGVVVLVVLTGRLINGYVM